MCCDLGFSWRSSQNQRVEKGLTGCLVQPTTQHRKFRVSPSSADSWLGSACRLPARESPPTPKLIDSTVKLLSTLRHFSVSTKFHLPIRQFAPWNSTCDMTSLQVLEESGNVGGISLHILRPKPPSQLTQSASCSVQFGNRGRVSLLSLREEFLLVRSLLKVQELCQRK